MLKTVLTTALTMAPAAAALLAGPVASALGTSASLGWRNAPLGLEPDAAADVRGFAVTAAPGPALVAAIASVQLPTARRQAGPVDCGPAALATVLAWYGRPLGVAAVARAAHRRADGVTLAELVRLAAAFELPGAWYAVPSASLASLPRPFIAHLSDAGGHYVAVRWVGRGFVLLADPAQGLVLERIRRFARAWSGRVLLFDGAVATVTGGAS